ncbi:hypothetical protein CAPTEDRAFT_225168 [Capitella teleta]|uniref:Myb/SANT-like DNA-binding domain-containing protein n=1 Tax=Capitella teleta TaxID=283909 RepID=R7T5W2_CAPTE|nr:hypothetical protein CAPTEDRAFT_225168 [Capitella teleta]|eukprot:ELT88819.1 hypothetical protein CAPTEDRAFT_225168 [Capitella teleta]
MASNGNHENKQVEKRKKNPNWTPCELEALFAGLEKHKDTIYGSFNKAKGNKQRNCQSARDRSNAWIEIALSIQGIGPIERTVSEVKKKKQCWFSEVKQKAARLRSLQGQTGAAGGIEAGDLQLSATEDRIVSIMGDTVISGIPGGVDSLEPYTFNEVVTLSQESVVLDEKPKPKKAKKEEASVTIAL